LMRSDLKTRVDAYSTLIDKSVLTPTEVRMMEGYSPEPIGDFFQQAPIQTPLNRGQEEE
jgi:phage portal protein BeeE